MIIFTTLLMSGCVINQEEVKPVSKVKTKKTKVLKQEIKKAKKEKVVLFQELTPLEKCKIKNGKLKNKYNLIISTPKYSKVKILNIKPKYHDCMIMSRGKYLVEVKKKGYKRKKLWFTLIYDTDLKIDLEKLPKITTVKKKKISKYIFKGYEAKYLMKVNSCIGFYPKSLVDSVLTISTTLKTFKSIRWSGKCKDKLMYGRGALYFENSKDLHVSLKGKMNNGFFDGHVYISAKASKKNKYSIKDSGSTYLNISLKTKDDYKNYQN